MDREALAKKIEETPIGPFAMLLGLNDELHFNEIVEARQTIVSALRGGPKLETFFDPELGHFNSSKSDLSDLGEPYLSAALRCRKSDR